MGELEMKVVEMYVEKKLSAKVVARELNYSESWVRKTLAKLGIPRRERRDAGHVREAKSDFAMRYSDCA